MDLTAKLPDEILIEILDHVPSLADKLRVESVSHRFQICLRQLLSVRAIPLEYVQGELNRYNVPLDLLTDAVCTLANKAKFNSINIGDGNTRQFHGFLSALASVDKDRLDRVRAFLVRVPDIYFGLTSLKEALTKCSKVSDVQLNWVIGDLKNWGPALEGKALTRLTLCLSDCKQGPLIQLCQSLKPNMLRKIGLNLYDTNMDTNQLVTELYGGAWLALEEINFNFRNVLNLDLAALFSSFTRLPALRKCVISLNIVQPIYQWSAALRSLFANHAEIRVQDYNYKSHTQTGCQIVALIRQVQSVHPEVRVGFGPDGDELTLTLGKVSFQKGPAGRIRACADANCMDCGRFYPTLVRSLKNRIDGMGEGHLPNGRLDRCRIDSIVVDLNKAVSSYPGWKALTAEMNQAHNQATITFEPLVSLFNYGLFQMTVDCGQCLNMGCFGCIDVE